MLIFRIIKSPIIYYNRLKYISVGLFFDLFYRKLTIEGLKFELPKYGNDRAGRGLMFLNNYEKPERELLKNAINPNSNVLELGACIGVVSCLTNKILNNPQNHLVVEANPLLIETLEQNKILNNCTFKIVNVLISENLENEFFIGDSMVESSMVAKSNHKVNIKGVSFDFLEKEYNIKYDTLIMDIEGGEYSVLINNRSFISSLNTIFLENHPSIIGQDKMNEYEVLLESLSFVKTEELFPISIWRKQKV